jgi:hypothetical protein
MEVREKGGQQYSPMIRGFQLYQTEWRVNQTADGQPGDRPMDRKGNDQGDMLEGKKGGGGSVHDWQRVKESVFRKF